MVSDSARKQAIRQRMSSTGENYTTAARAIDDTGQARPTGTTTVLDIDPRLLAPYPDELVRPSDAGPDWRPVTTAELGWRVLAADATPTQRAHAESVWRPVTSDRPCRCSGDCLHGRPCDTSGEDGPCSCTGRLVHQDRLAAPPINIHAWYDLYTCDHCGEQYEVSVDLPAVPWGKRIEGGTAAFEGIRQVVFHDYEPDVCPDCGDIPCDCGRVYCDECGADSHYRCSCEDH